MKAGVQRWLDALGDPLARRMGRRIRPWRLLVAAQGNAIDVRSRDRSLGAINPDSTPPQVAALREAIAGEPASARRHVHLRLSENEVLRKTVQVPSAAGDLIQPILETQIERITPWPRADVRFGYRIITPAVGSRGMLDVEVVATGVPILRQLEKRIEEIGLSAVVVSFAPQDGDAVTLMDRGPTPQQRAARVVHGALAASLVVLMALGGWGAYRIAAIAAEQRQVAGDIAGLRNTLASTQPGAGPSAIPADLAAEIANRTASPRKIALLDALSTAVPDDAYLTDLEMSGEDIRLTGKSTNVAAIVPRLEDAPYFAAVRFAAPTTRDEAGRESLALSMRIEPEPVSTGAPR